ncbi:protein L (plasmid) [Escherichia marmotae]|nr:protein L [Escherichia marmotae]WFZ17265.1 protein L [Escherichia marmotae]
MANYKYSNELHQNNHADFDKVHTPNTAAPYPGIYKCTGCGREIAIAGGHNLPPQNHHQHQNPLTSIQWKLVVCTTDKT